MSKSFRRGPVFRVAASVAVAGLAGAGAFVGASPAQSIPADTACPEAFPVADLVAGDLVDGLTVSSGNEPDEFTGEVLGVLDDGIAVGLDMILVRLTSDEIDRVGGIWAGMSGSPVYAADGRLIGAVSYGLAWGSSPVAGVTPAADMQELLTREPESTAFTAGRKIALSERMQSRLVASGAATEAEADSGLKRLPIPVALSGMYNANRFNTAAKKLGLDNVKFFRAGSAPSAQAAEEEIFAGSNLAASLSYGDLSAVGFGTTTMVCDGKPVGFGHPFDFAGETSLTLHASDTIYVQEDPLGFPFKVSNAGGPVGTIDQDRLPGIKGVLGVLPETSEVETTVIFGSRNRTGTTHVSVPDFNASAAAFGLLSNQDRVFDHVGRGAALVHFLISGTTGDGEPFTLVRTNRYANTYDISFDTIWEVGDAVWALTQNDLVDVEIDSVEVTSTMSAQARMFRVGKVQVQRNDGVWRTLTSDSRVRAKAGRLLNFRVVLESRRNKFGSKLVAISVRVPSDVMPGTFGSVSLGQGGYGECEECYYEEEGPASFQELVDSIEDAPRNDAFNVMLDLYDEIEGGLSSSKNSRLVGDVITNSKSFEVRIVR
ncbi:MAG TPA: hypothetical protein VFK52_03120 [Nocardioidaceae bacterium]|nr:hypothetical protein [Nocardioidaceae bacterium]